MLSRGVTKSQVLGMDGFGAAVLLTRAWLYLEAEA